MGYLSANLLGAAVKKIVGGFTLKQMIAIGVVAALAILVGVLIGALCFYRAGIRKGKRQGLKDAVSIAMKKAEEKSASVVKEKEAALAENQKLKKELAALKEGSSSAQPPSAVS